MALELSHPGQDLARRLDAEDRFAGLRERFLIPPSPAHQDERPSIYLCGNSLGLQPRATRQAMLEELDDWARLGVEGHFHARHPWFPAHEAVRAGLAELVGAQPHEVVAMNSLTVNLHLLMLSFFRPAAGRGRILIEAPCFPSDVYAVKSQLRLHGLDPEADLVWALPRAGEATLRTEDLEATIAREGPRLGLVLLAGVNYLTGQVLDLPRLAAACRAAGVPFGVDLAHAAGNVPLRLHEWGVDFAAWCSYKYVNAGPGALAGAFVHERHLGRDGDEAFARFARQPRLEGWWGNDPRTRFTMGPEFQPVPSADAWQLSNPPVLALAPLRVSLETFSAAGGVPALREKSRRLTGYLAAQLAPLEGERLEVLTPRDEAARGCQLSLRLPRDGRAIHARLQAEGVICDFREPDVVRVAPVPLYNRFQDCWAFARALEAALR